MRHTAFLITISALAAAAAIPASAEETDLQLDLGSTKVEFTLGDILHTVHGTFKLKSGDIHFDPTTGKASGALVVDAKSGDSGSGARDSRMHKNILQSDKYPDIVFRPDRVDGAINLQGDSDLRIHGTFRIHGGDHEMVLPAKTHIAGQQMTAVIRFPVPYVKWGMKNPSTLFLRVNDTVDISIQAVGHLGVMEGPRQTSAQAGEGSLAAAAR